jgi:hypothetical protein
MDKQEIIEKITEKKQFSELPRSDVLRAFEKFDTDKYSDEEKVKLTRDFVRKVFSGCGGVKLSLKKAGSVNEILKKHLSTRERFEHYAEVYGRVLKNLPRKISVIDLGSGINGLSYKFFEGVKKEVNYVGVEAVGQFVELTNDYFKKENLSGKAIHLSLFELDGIKKLIKETKKPRIVFMFKVVDALEKFERDYTKKFLEEIMPLVDRCVISFPTESWMRRKKFHVQRKWLTEFIKGHWQFTDDFTIGGERYLVFEK